jgi:hypothetical protein
MQTSISNRCYQSCAWCNVCGNLKTCSKGKQWDQTGWLPFFSPFRVSSDLDFLMACSLHVHDELNWLPFFFSIPNIKWFRFSNGIFITCSWWTQLITFFSPFRASSDLDFLMTCSLHGSCSRILLNCLVHNCVQLFFFTNVRFHIRHGVLLSRCY